MNALHTFLARRWMTMVYALWVFAFLGLLKNARYTAFLRPEFGYVIGLGVVTLVGFLLTDLVKTQEPAIPTFDLPELLRALVLLLPLAFICNAQGTSLDAYAFDHRWLGVSGIGIETDGSMPENSDLFADTPSLSVASPESESAMVIQRPAPDLPVVEELPRQISSPVAAIASERKIPADAPLIPADPDLPLEEPTQTTAAVSVEPTAETFSGQKRSTAVDPELTNLSNRDVTLAQLAQEARALGGADIDVSGEENVEANIPTAKAVETTQQRPQQTTSTPASADPETDDTDAMTGIMPDAIGPRIEKSPVFAEQDPVLSAQPASPRPAPKPKQSVKIHEVTILDLYYSPRLYEGKRVRLVGMLHRKDQDVKKFFGKELPVIFRFVITCCAADASPVAVIADVASLPDLVEGSWVQIEGTFGMVLKNKRQVPFLKDASLKSIKQPKQPYLF